MIWASGGAEPPRVNEIRADQIEALRTDCRICKVAHAGQDLQSRAGNLDAGTAERQDLAVAQRAEQTRRLFQILFLHAQRHRIVLLFVAVRESMAADLVSRLPQDAGIDGDLLRLPGNEKERQASGEFPTSLQHLLEGSALILLTVMGRVIDIASQEDWY